MWVVSVVMEVFGSFGVFCSLGVFVRLGCFCLFGGFARLGSFGRLTVLFVWAVFSIGWFLVIWVVLVV